MLSPLHYCDEIYSEYGNGSHEIEFTSSNNYNIHVAKLKTKFEEATQLVDNKTTLMIKKRLNKMAVEKLLKSRGFLKGNEITYGALVLPDYNKSDSGIERDNNRYNEEREKLWTPIRNQPNIKVSDLIKNLQDLDKQCCLKTPSRYLKRAFENLKLESMGSPVPYNNDFPVIKDTGLHLKPKEVPKKPKSTLIPVFNKRQSPQGFSLTKLGLKNLHKMNGRKIKESGDFLKTKVPSTKLTRKIEHNKLTKKSKIPVLSKQVHLSNYESTDKESEC